MTTEVPNKTRKRNKPEMLGKVMSNCLFTASPVIARVSVLTDLSLIFLSLQFWDKDPL